MDFRDKIGQFAKTAADKTKEMADKTKEMMEINRLNAKLNSEQEQITALKSKIGDFYWEKFQMGEAWDPALDDVCADIRAGLERIIATQSEIQKLKDASGGGGAADAAFCSSCGARNLLGAKFCKECGTKL